MSTNNEGTPTPLTDAAVKVHNFGESGKHSYIDPDFARQLERDLTATKQRLEAALEAIEDMDRIHDDIMTNGPRCTCGEGDEWCRRCAKSSKLSDIARAALHPSADKAESNEGKS